MFAGAGRVVCRGLKALLFTRVRGLQRLLNAAFYKIREEETDDSCRCVCPGDG